MPLAVLDGVMGVTKVKNSKFYDATSKTPTDAAFISKGFIAAIGLMAICKMIHLEQLPLTLLTVQ